MTPSCHRHVWETAEATCLGCGLGYCQNCLFYVENRIDRPMCVPCALAKAGVRGARKPRVPRRHRRRAIAEQERARAEAAAAMTAAPPTLDEVHAAEAARAVDAARAMETTGPDGSWATLDSTHWDIRPA